MAPGKLMYIWRRGGGSGGGACETRCGGEAFPEGGSFGTGSRGEGEVSKLYVRG